jgi:tetratricopeptide (TPR) repeat protein
MDRDKAMFRFAATCKFICLCSFFLMLFAPTICRADADAIYKENNGAVVVVVAIDGKGRPIGQGSGFIIREDGAVVTNYHVISMAADVKFKLGMKVLDAEGVLHVDPENDLAIVKMEGKDYPRVRIGDSNKLRVGEKIYVIGSPQGLENTISEGILSGIREVDRKHKILQMTAPISPGSSGGPLFNGDGEVVGVATFLIASTQNLNFAMPINLVLTGLVKKELVSPRDACQVDYTETAACWYYQGLAFGTSGQLDRAADAFRHSLAIDSKKTETYINLGVTYANMGRYTEAMEMLSQAVKIEPDHPDALSKLGAVYGQMGKYKESLAALSKSAALKPGNPENYFVMAVTYGKMGNFKESIQAAAEAIKLNPKYAEAHGFLGFAFASSGMHKEAASAYKAAIRLEPDNPEAHFGLGKAYAAMSERSSALEEYKILRKLNAKMADELFNLIYK